MIHRSKKDLWLVWLVAAVILVPFILSLYYIVLPNGNAEAGWYLLFMSLLMMAITVWVTYPLNYEITSSSLIIRSGMLRKEILLSAIQAVHSSTSLCSAATWSLDRLRVDYKQDGATKYVLVSPVNKAEFLSELALGTNELQLLEECIERVDAEPIGRFASAAKQHSERWK